MRRARTIKIRQESGRPESGHRSRSAVAIQPGIDGGPHSRHVEPSDLNCFYSLGIDPLQKRYVMLKSRVHWRAGLGAMAKAVVDLAGIGACTSDYGSLTFKNVRRPIYPLDLPNR